MIHGIIDIGSNTIRMAIYDINGQQIDFLMKKKHMVGLAAYLENNVMSQAGIDKVCEVLFEFKAFLEIFHIPRNNLHMYSCTADNLCHCFLAVFTIAQSSRSKGINIGNMKNLQKSIIIFGGICHDSRHY